MASSFIKRVKAALPFDTISTMEDAAEDRFWDGFLLAANSSHETGSIYILGYVAEILVKTAYYRYSQIPLTQDISQPRKILNSLSASWPQKTNFHSINVWVDTLIAERARLADPLDPVIAGLLKIHTLRIWAHWRETLRYVAIPAPSEVLHEVYESVEWLRSNYVLLWR